MPKKNPIQPSWKLVKDSQQNPPKQINTPVTLSFEHVAPGSQHCISECTKDELKDILDCLRQLTTLTWNQILQQRGNSPGHRKGLAFTTYPDTALRTVTRPIRFAQEIAIGAVRASRGGRVFGGYKSHVFYVLWFDRSHQIVPAD
jgi:hypothetical protein